uniref:Integrase catalytic domain-containing protein n=1 Tax=Daphnia galeata TaxID=27404 RepID=A0A8J2RNQ2_9CRUS|nr:unnamed protein product [Daphnia galeata]
MDLLLPKLLPVVRKELLKYPDIGLEFLNRHLQHSLQIRVPRWRLRQAVVMIRGHEGMKNRRLHRRRYKVRAPLSMVHVDTHHKLIRWRFIFVGAVDGFSRKIFCLKVDNNNTAVTVLKHFKEGVDNVGLPSRIRTDKGRENVGIAHYMVILRGSDRSSIITGRSVHNTRIERLWRDTFRIVVFPFYHTFYRLEDRGYLDPSSEIDLFCLHYVFRPLLEKATADFVNMWDCHRLRTEGLSPNQLFTLGIEDLRRRSKKERKNFTELEQGISAFQNYFRHNCKLKSSAASEAIQNFHDRALIFSQIRAQCKQKSNLVIHAEFPSDIIFTT